MCVDNLERVECRTLHGVSHKHTPFHYVFHVSLSEPAEQHEHDVSSSSRPGPSVDAIIEATSTAGNYRNNRINDPVKHSLKPKRI